MKWEFLISNLIIINHTQKENAVLLALKDLLAHLAPLVLRVLLDLVALLSPLALLVFMVLFARLALVVLLVQQALVLTSHQMGIMIWQIKS